MSNYKVGDRVRLKNLPEDERTFARNGKSGTVARVLDEGLNGGFTTQVQLDNGGRLFFRGDEIEPLNNRGYVITRGELEDLLAWDDRDERRKIVDGIIRGEDTP